MTRTIPSLALLLYHHSQNEARFSAEETDYIHAADLYDLCVRQVFLLKKEGKKLVRTTPPGTRMLWEMGRAVEKYIISSLMERGLAKLSQPLFDNEFGVVGNPDLRLVDNQIVECKGKDPALFRLMRNEPLLRDRVQVWIYLWLDKSTTARLIAATWGAMKNPFKEFIVRYNAKIPELIKTTLSPLREVEAGGILPHRICGGIDDLRARNCPVKNICFNLESTATIETLGQAVERIYGGM